MVKLKLSIVILSLFFLFAIFSTDNHLAQNGVLDISNAQFNTEIYKLHGDWHIYKNQFINPLIPGILPAETIKVPSLFKPSHKNSMYGFASLKLDVLLPPADNRILQIRLNRVIAAYTLFINGKEILQNGKPGKSIKDSKADYSPSSITFPFDGVRLQIVLHISNFQSPTGAGIFQEISIGTPDYMNKKSLLPILFELIIAGFLFTTGIYHTILFFFRKNDKSPLFLGLFCLIMGIRPLFLNSFNIYLIFNNFSWIILHKIEIFSIIGSTPFLALFFYEIFPDFIKKQYINIYCFLAGILIILLFVLPAPFFYHTLTVFYLPSIALSIYTITHVFRAIIKKIPSSVNFFIGFLILFISIVNDMLYTLGVINSFFSLSYGVFIFIFAQTTIIADRHNRIFKKSVSLSKELLQSNDTYIENNKKLEAIIQERKKELECEIIEKEIIKEELNKHHNIESIGILAGGIAHDFNNLLTIMLGNIFLAKQLTDSEQLLTSLTDAENAGNKATQLANQLLTFSKGGTPVKKISDLKDLIITSTSYTLQDTPISYQVDIEDDLHICEIDTVQITQVINNILINAIQAIQNPGSIVVKAFNYSNSQFNGKLSKGNYVAVSFTDSGTGISENIKEKIFDPFFTTKNHAKGLGLSICYSIIQKHGGTITCESKINVGTTFTIYIKSKDQKITESDSFFHSTVENNTYNVLIIDDEYFILKIVKQMLNILNIECSIALNGIEGINLFNNALLTDKKFDIVIVDLTNPDSLSGVEIIQKLKEINPDFHAIATSGYSNSPILNEPEKYGFTAILKKPFELNDLKKLLFEILNK